MLTKFDEQSQKAIVIGESIAFDFGHPSVGSEHLLLAILKMTDAKLTNALQKYDVDDKKIEDDIIRLFGRSDDQPFYMEYSEIVQDILENAIQLVKETASDKVSINILSLALLESRESVAMELLKKYKVDIEEIIFEMKENSDLESKLDQIPTLINLNKRMKENKKEIVGREKEIEQLCMILSKKEKSNALIIGQAGVGKSALVEKLAMMINEKKVIPSLQKTLIYELNLSGVVSGTKYRGEFEEKLKKIIDKVKGLDNVVLFIDEIHTMIGAGGAEGAIDASNILKPYIARKDITIIGATTTSEYYQYFEPVQAMNRRFSIVMLQENTREETKQILLQNKAYYEQYHGILLPDDCLDYLLETVTRYMKNRTFPDKAIDILDLACVKTKFLQAKTVTKDILKQTIEEYTKIKIDQEYDYPALKESLKKKVIGQDSIIDTFINHLAYPKKQRNKPQGVYLFTGRTGVGKTELVKQLSIFMNKPIIRLDMSEYKDPTSLQKILGSPPGYIGYEKSSLFLEKLTTNQKSIILLDEIEKAHPDVLHLFLQVLDEGYLEDNQKRKIYFHDCLIIMTANIFQQNNGLGFKKTKKQDNIYHYFSDEFINRIDYTFQFFDLSKDAILTILQNNCAFELSSKELENLLNNYQIHLGARGALRQLQQYLIQKEVLTYQ